MRSTSSSAGVVFGSHRKHLPDVLNDSGFCLVGMNWDLIVSWLEGESSLSSVVCSFHSSVVNIHKHVLDAFLFGRIYSKLNSTSFRSLFYSDFIPRIFWFSQTFLLLEPLVYYYCMWKYLKLYLVFRFFFSPLQLNTERNSSSSSTESPWWSQRMWVNRLHIFTFCG